MSHQATPFSRKEGQRSARCLADGNFHWMAAIARTLVLLGGLVLLGSTARLHAQPSAERPNVVLIYADDLGWKDVGFMGSPYFHTPNLDRLARQGMVFTDAYANGPNCAPSRAALLTGQYAPRTGIYTVNSPARGPAHLRRLIPTPNKRTLPREAVTIADALSEAGYATASIGKWHLGDPPEHGPEAQGFDVNVGGYHVGTPGRFGGYFSPWTNPFLNGLPANTHLTDHLTDEALAFVDQHADRPFFLYLSYYGVHAPWRAPGSLVQKYEGRSKGAHRKIKPVYGALVELFDRNVGRLLTKLQTSGLLENTIIIFTSDNGGHPLATSMHPLRGHKRTLYEGGIRVPLAVRWPGVTAQGSTCDTPVIGTDFFATLLEMTGTAVPEGKLLDGQSFVPLLQGCNGQARRALYWHFPAYLQSYAGSSKDWGTTPGGAIRKGPWKLIQFFETGRTELYHLERDLDESHNLASERPQKAAQMLRLLKKWRRSTGAPVPATPNPAYDPDTADSSAEL